MLPLPRSIDDVDPLPKFGAPLPGRAYAEAAAYATSRSGKDWKPVAGTEGLDRNGRGQLRYTSKQHALDGITTVTGLQMLLRAQQTRRKVEFYASKSGHAISLLQAQAVERMRAGFEEALVKQWRAMNPRLTEKCAELGVGYGLVL